AKDGIRDDLVTGVQTCALPISSAVASGKPLARSGRCRSQYGRSLHRYSILASERRFSLPAGVGEAAEGVFDACRQETPQDPLARDRKSVVEGKGLVLS